VFHTIPITWKASLLQNIGVSSNLPVEKPTAILLFSNVNEQREEK
jgi:hypothetical protein